jgi:hypothetical protein
MSSKRKGKWDSDSEEEEQTLPHSAVGVNDHTSPIAPSLLLPSINSVQSSEELLPLAPVIHEQASISNYDNDREDNFSQREEKVSDISKSKVKVHIPLFHGCRSIDEYDRVNFIDQGTYGLVFKARCKITGDVVAIKQIKESPLSAKVGFPITALRETNILLALQHPNIIRVREMVVGSSVDKVYMVMDYCDMDLKQCLEAAGGAGKITFSLGEVSL